MRAAMTGLSSPKRRSADQTWLRPPRVVVEKIEALLELGKSDTAIRNHHSMVEYDISEEQIANIRSDYEAARDWEVCDYYVWLWVLVAA